MTNTILTQNQIDFIVNKYFAPHKDKYAGAVNIGRKLLTQETVIVAGNDCIFNGGIGNFINTRKAENFVDCLEYKLDLYALRTSKMFFADWEDEFGRLTTELETTKEKINDMESLVG
jgi:hypothetical protein